MSITTKVKPGLYKATAVDGTKFLFEKGEDGWCYYGSDTNTLIGGFETKKAAITHWLDNRAAIESRQQVALRGLRNEFEGWVAENHGTFDDLWNDYRDGLNGEPTISFLQFVAMVLVKGGKGEDAKQTNTGNEWKTTFANHDEVDKAVYLGVINNRQGAAYKANITISQKTA